jgi:hypothetical protein
MIRITLALHVSGCAGGLAICHRLKIFVKTYRKMANACWVSKYFSICHMERQRIIIIIIIIIIINEN